MLELSQDIGHRLRVHELSAKASNHYKGRRLTHKQYQAQMTFPTQSPMEIALKARSLFEDNYLWMQNVRAITVRAINLVSDALPQQLDLFDDAVKREKRDRLEDTIEKIRMRFGNRAIYSASLMGDIKMPGRGVNEVVMPGIMYT